MARARVILSRSALVHNYRLLSEKVPHLRLLPMVKANAYGHDAIYSAKALLKEKNLHGFGVATFPEAIALRKALNGNGIGSGNGLGKEAPILVFSDTAPWTQELQQLCIKFALEPVFSELSSLQTFQTSVSRLPTPNSKLQTPNSYPPFHLELNTGMNRLGIQPEALSEIRLPPTSVFTHLANADEPKCTSTQKQMKSWAAALPEIQTRFPNALLHFSNSSAIWNAKQYPLTRHMHLARPGLSLYGMRPYAKVREDPFRRVMRILIPVLNRIYLKRGDEVGYGGTYRCSKKTGEWVATLGAGYADGIFRSLGSRGIVSFQGKRLPFLGRVSMDLCAIRAARDLKIGDEVEFWGDAIDPYIQAGFAGTIPYEITTRIGERVERVYE